MRIRNADGSEAEACGNATRCVADLLYRETRDSRLRIETAAGLLEAEALADGSFAIDMGPARTAWHEIPLVRVHVTDTLRDLLGVRGAARAWTLRAAMQRIAEAGIGVVVVLRQQESAGELTEAVRSFAAAVPAAPPAVPESAADAEGTVLRTFGVGAQILKDLGVKRMRVLSAPKQMHGISAFGLEVDSYVGYEG